MIEDAKEIIAREQLKYSGSMVLGCYMEACYEDEIFNVMTDIKFVGEEFDIRYNNPLDNNPDHQFIISVSNSLRFNMWGFSMWDWKLEENINTQEEAEYDLIINCFDGYHDAYTSVPQTSLKSLLLREVKKIVGRW